MRNLIFEIGVNAEGDQLCVANVEGDDCGYRISGPKAWGGMRTTAKLRISQPDMLRFITECCPELADLIAEKRTTFAPSPEQGQVAPGSGWIRCSERLPTEADSDFSGHVIWWSNPYSDLRAEGWEPQAMSWNPNHWGGGWFDKLPDELYPNITHWMPTGLKSPNPPAEDE